jgi:Cu2+-containing amine oxidase
MLGKERAALVAALDAATEKIAQADVAGANAAIADLRVILFAIPDMVNDAHGIIEGMKDAPDWLHALAKAGQADADKVLAVLGHYGTLGVKLNALLADLREGRLKMVTETRIVKG